MSARPILIMAGGTGGHVYPALAVAEALQQASRKVVWLGTRRGIEARLVPAAGIDIEWVNVAGLRGKGLRHYCWLRFGWSGHYCNRCESCGVTGLPQCSAWAALLPDPAG